MSRPESVARFELLFLISLALGVINSALMFRVLAGMAGVGFLLVVQVGTVAIILALLFWASRYRSNIARWLLLVMFVIGCFTFLTSVGELLAIRPLSALVSTIQVVCQVAALYFAFRPDAAPWFRKAPRGQP